MKTHDSPIIYFLIPLTKNGQNKSIVRAVWNVAGKKTIPGGEKANIWSTRLINIAIWGKCANKHRKEFNTYMIVGRDRRSWFLLKNSSGVLCHDLGSGGLRWMVGENNRVQSCITVVSQNSPSATHRRVSGLGTPVAASCCLSTPMLAGCWKSLCADGKRFTGALSTWLTRSRRIILWKRRIKVFQSDVRSETLSPSQESNRIWISLIFFYPLAYVPLYLEDEIHAIDETRYL